MAATRTPTPDGALGAGPNRMNRSVVIRAAAGLTAYLKSLSDSPLVVVGFDARHLQQRQPQGAHAGVQRLDLLAQFRGQRWTMRLVSGELFVTEGLAGGIEHHRQIVGPVVGQQPAQHVQHAVQRAGRRAGLGAQRRSIGARARLGQAVARQ